MTADSEAGKTLNVEQPLKVKKFSKSSLTISKTTPHYFKTILKNLKRIY